MNETITTLLGIPVIRATCARLLAAIPATDRLLPYVRTPVQDSFIAFVAAMRSVEPDAPTQCAGWTVHELIAHVAAGSAEIADLVEREVAGSPTRATRGFEEREAPYRQMTPARLRRAFFDQSLRAAVAVDRLSKAGESRRVTFTGAHLDARTLLLHIESELVLHRWDIVGDDPAAIAALSEGRFAVHAATTVAAMTPNVFPPRVGDGGTIVLRAPGAPDIAVTGGSTTTIALADPDDPAPVVQCHPAARTLMLWGRTPGAALSSAVGEPSSVDTVVEMLRPAPSLR
jgi:uncharacterized protein (TIGR03083 family)